jgi:hypothetical protein
MNLKIQKNNIFPFRWLQLQRAMIYPIYCLLLACSPSGNSIEETNEKIQILPDYSGITIPYNIAPLNFTILKAADRYFVEMGNERNKKMITIKSGDGTIHIPVLKWHKLLDQCRGGNIYLTIYLKADRHWTRFPVVINHVVNEPIDRFLVYRIIEPGFETWKTMGIYQRCLENFNEKPILTNNLSDDNCMNCHSFCMNSSKTMLFHMRAANSGTVIYRNGKLTKVNTKTARTISPAVYPAWHPGGRYVAFSVNQIIQTFHASKQKRIEVIDTLSDLIIYDTQTNSEFSNSAISSAGRFETFPAWSPDGKYLYYCSARALPYTASDRIRYDLLCIAFDTASCRFGKVDTVLSSSRLGRSVSFPRVSPDGKFISFCLSNYGTFSIWHKESDLYLKNLVTGEITRPEINSENSESYHSWSSTGRYIVFSSRRDDGLFTRFFFAYVDSSGMAHKPFILPQENPEFYNSFLKSYNIPELVTSEVPLNPGTLLPVIHSKPVPASFDTIR